MKTFDDILLEVVNHIQYEDTPRRTDLIKSYLVLGWITLEHLNEAASIYSEQAYGKGLEDGFACMPKSI